MEPVDHDIIAHQRRALDVMLDALGRQHARDDADHAERRIELGRNEPALFREKRRLHQRLTELTHELEALETKLDAVDRAIDSRIDAERERRLEDI